MTIFDASKNNERWLERERERKIWVCIYLEINKKYLHHTAVFCYTSFYIFCNISYAIQETQQSKKIQVSHCDFQHCRDSRDGSGSLFDRGRGE